MDQQLHGEHHPDVAADYMNLGNIQFQWGHYTEAEKYHRQALEIYQAWYGNDSSNTADIMNYVAKDLVSESRYDNAEILLNEALAAFEHAYGRDPHPSVAMALGQLGTIALKRGKLDEAERDYARTIEIDRAVYGDQHQFTALALSNLADVYLERGHYVRAETLLRDAIQRLTQAHLAEHVNTGIARLKLGRTLLREKRYPDAETELLAGYGIVKRAAPTVSWLQKARQDLVTLYDALNQPEKAIRFRSELVTDSAPEVAKQR
jgi:tetratricopeptide (TPR) repeat protein